MHLVLIKRGRAHGYQLRWGEHTRGETAYFGVRKHGGVDRAKEAALERARQIDEPWCDRTRRKPSVRKGELVSSQPCSIGGLRWEWRMEDDGRMVFYVAAVWANKSGRESSSSSSARSHGVDGAVKRAIQALERHEAPFIPAHEVAVAAARAELERGPRPLLAPVEQDTLQLEFAA